MAQIIVSTIDNENGSINVITKFNDEDLIRVYNAYKHKYAAAVLKKKMDSGVVLEASDTIENIKSHLDSTDILTRIVERFMKDLVHGAYGIEQQIILDSNPIEEIVYNI